LSNKETKQSYIGLLGKRLSESGCDVLYAEGDADLLIVQTAVTMSNTCPVVLVGDDMDLFVLSYHAWVELNIFFHPEPRKEALMESLSAKAARSSLGKNVCINMLFVHDTTSRLYGIGKATELKLIMDNEHFRQLAQIFESSDSSKDEIMEAGEKAMVILYRGKETDVFDTMRHQRFQELVTVSRKAIHPNMLPPTSTAAKYHSLRVFHQVQVWKGNSLNAKEWHWKICAPLYLLKLVRCTCKSSCGTLRCGCRHHGLECSAACSERRQVCENVTPPDDNTDKEDGD